MKVVIGYAALAVVVICLTTALVTSLRPAFEVPFATLNKVLSGSK